MEEKKIRRFRLGAIICSIIVFFAWLLGALSPFFASASASTGKSPITAFADTYSYVYAVIPHGTGIYIEGIFIENEKLDYSPADLDISCIELQAVDNDYYFVSMCNYYGYINDNNYYDVDTSYFNKFEIDNWYYNDGLFEATLQDDLWFVVRADTLAELMANVDSLDLSFSIVFYDVDTDDGSFPFLNATLYGLPSNLTFEPFNDTENAYNNGYNKGKVDGYSLGMSNGIANPFTAFLSPVGEFFEINLFGNFSVGDFFSVVLFVSLAVIFLKMFSGG